MKFVNLTRRIEIGTAVVPIQTRHPMIMAQQALTTQVVCGGRFTLGIGPSHHWIVNSQLGLPYDRPARLVGDYLDVLGAAFAGPGTVDVDNESYCVHSPIEVTEATAGLSATTFAAASRRSVFSGAAAVK